MILKIVPELAEAPPDDQALMGLVRDESAGAFRELVTRHLVSVRRFCARAASMEVADDLAQDTFTRLWQSRHRWEPSASFPQFLFSIALNLCRNHHRGRQRRLRALDGLATEPQPVLRSADEALVARAEWNRVQAAIDTLPEAQREAVLLRFTAELDSEALGQALGCNASTARSRVFFGLKRLRDLLGGTP